MDTAQLTWSQSSGPLQRIGAGFCGTVWASSEDPESLEEMPPMAMKREDGGPGRSLRNEYEIHKRLLQAHQMHSTRVLLPFCFGFIDKAAALWAGILPRLPKGYEECNALVNEKIPSLCERAREKLVRKYCPVEHQDEILRDVNNRHCLARVYLGRRRRPDTTQGGRPRAKFFSLRNFPLQIDQLEDLELATAEYAEAMADTLAFLHWAAKVDANDVEFVLGRPRLAIEESSGFPSGALGNHAMWMLDFDCCKPLSMDEEGVEEAARCFWRNDPYYPRPPGPETPASDAELWQIFQKRFLDSSKGLLRDQEEDVQRLPSLLIKRITETRGTFSKSAFA